MSVCGVRVMTGVLRSPRGGDAGDFFANLRRLATVTSIKVCVCVCM